MLEYNQTQPELQRLEGERQALISRLGESMYHMWRTNQFSREAFEALCRDIRRCEEAIDACRAAPAAPGPDWGLGAQPGSAAQPGSGAQLGSGAQPGPVPQPPQAPPAAWPDQRPTAPAGAVCPCGNRNPAGARFCTKCGQPLA